MTGISSDRNRIREGEQSINQSTRYSIAAQSLPSHHESQTETQAAELDRACDLLLARPQMARRTIFCLSLRSTAAIKSFGLLPVKLLARQFFSFVSLLLFGRSAKRKP